jgi:hypothetical protein
MPMNDQPKRPSVRRLMPSPVRSLRRRVSAPDTRHSGWRNAHDESHGSGAHVAAPLLAQALQRRRHARRARHDAQREAREEHAESLWRAAALEGFTHVKGAEPDEADAPQRLARPHAVRVHREQYDIGKAEHENAADAGH